MDNLKSQRPRNHHPVSNSLIVKIPSIVHRIRLLTLLACLAPLPVTGEEFEKVMRPLLEAHCVNCHGVEEAKGDVTLAGRSGEITPESVELWERVLEQLVDGSMPPRKARTRPTGEEREAAIAWIEKALTEHVVRPPVLRRLNRREYEHTLHDLLGIDVPLSGLLPEDGLVDGFDSVATGLDLSSILLERYLEAAEVAFEATIRRIRPLPPETRRCVLMEQKENIASVKGKKGGVISEHGAFIDFTPGWPPSRVDAAHPIEPGVYRCRVAVWPHDPGDRTLSVAIFVGELFNADHRRFVGIFDVTGTPEEPRIIEFETHLGENHAMHILPWIYPEHVTWRDKHEARPGVGIVWAETHGPLDQAFPSKSQIRLFGQSESLEMVEGERLRLRKRRGVMKRLVNSKEPREDVERILRAFIPRAFRRPTPEALIRPFVDLAHARLDAGSSFEDAVRVGVTAVLCSPHFLLLHHEEEADEHSLASRLSYFLWSSLPDAELAGLAAGGKLEDSEVLHSQVERMLRDPKSQRFVESFTDQWLDLRDIDDTTPDGKLYPEYDELLFRSMLGETRAFFRHVLDGDLSVLNFIDSEFALLNERLARHYGIEGVRGHEKLRVVPLPEGSLRGGVLTHASVLKVTANGTNSSPVVRGAWVLDRILGQAPSPPPPDVPAVEPDIRGATTIREQLAKHREDAACTPCHARIDPPGFALEEFNAIGGAREWYRTLGGKGKRVGKNRYHVGPDVDSSGELPDGRKFSGFREFRAHLLARPEPFVRSLTEKLLLYAIGRPLTVADRPGVDRIIEKAKKNGLGLKSLIHAVVESELFLGAS